MPSAVTVPAEPIPGYRVIERLGRGGFGEVWKAEAPGGLFKAIKFVFGEITPGAGRESQAEQELKALARMREIRHPFILSMERFDIVEGRLVIVMELADRNMEDRLRECQGQGLPGIPRRELLKYLNEAAEALDLLNSQYDLQHLDIKPQNLFLVSSHVKVADFGLVKDLEGASAKMTGGVTQVYAPPETFNGWVSRNSDQYSLGIVYQEMLTGRRPFIGPSARQYMMQHLTAEPDLSSLPACDRPVLLRALAKNPDERFPTCAAFIEELMLAAEGETPRATIVPVNGAQVSTRPASGILAGDLSTQNLGESDLASSMRTSLRSTPIIQRPELQVSNDGTLCPTLVIGLGRTGIRCLERMRAKLRVRFGSPGSWPPIRLLSLDTDPDVLRELEKTEAVSRYTHDQTLLCKLQKPVHYYKRWAEMRHLSSWMDSNILFEMSPSGTTSGHRALGRLAFVDNYRRILSRLRKELDQLLSATTIDAAKQATGQKLRRQEPKVFVVTHMGGGTGSGMFIDLCYLLRRVLTEAGSGVFDVQGILLSGIDRDNSELSRINQYALAQDLLDLTQPDAEFNATYEVDNVLERYAAPPLQAAYFFDTSAEHLLEPKEEVVMDAISEFVCHGSTSVLGRQFDFRSQSDGWPRFRSIGWFSLVYPLDRLVQRTAARLCESLVGNWVQPVDDRVGERIGQHADEAISGAGFDPGRLAQLLVEANNLFLPMPMETMLGQRLYQLVEDLNQSKAMVHDELVRRAVADLVSMLGADFPEDSIDESLFAQPCREGTNKIANGLLRSLIELTAGVSDSPGPRLEHCRWTVEGFTSHFQRICEQQRQGEEIQRQQVLQLRRDLQIPNKPAAVRLDLLKKYCESKIGLIVCQQLTAVYRMLLGKLADQTRDLHTLRMRTEQLLEMLRAEASKPAYTAGGFCSENLFPGGGVHLDRAADAVYRQIFPNLLETLEQAVQERLLGPAGGFWRACSGGELTTKDLATRLQQVCAQWVREVMPSGDVAQCFFDRQKGNVGAQVSELRSFFQWSTPSVYGRGDDARLNQAFFVGYPASPPGEQLRTLLQQAASEQPMVEVAGIDQVVLCRVAAHGSLGRLLPMWLLEGRRLYDAACGTKVSPEILSQHAANR